MAGGRKMTAADVSEEIRLKLEDLLMEGMVVGANVDEMNSLIRLLLAHNQHRLVRIASHCHVLNRRGWCHMFRPAVHNLRPMVKVRIALYGLETHHQLKSVTCHMGSHSVTCHPTQVNAPCWYRNIYTGR